MSFVIFSISGWSCRCQGSTCAECEKYSFAGGADADRLASHRRYSRFVHRPRLKRQRLRPISGCVGPKSVALFQGSAPSSLERPDSFGGPRHQTSKCLSRRFEPRTNVETRSEPSTHEKPNTMKCGNSSGGHPPPNQPMERTPPCCARRRRSSAR